MKSICHTLCRLSAVAFLSLMAGLQTGPSLAGDNGSGVQLAPAPAPLKEPVKLRIGVLRISYTVVMHELAERLKRFNVEPEFVEFVRYADARTALASGSLDIATLGPGDIAVALTQGIDEVVGLSGLGTAHRYVVVRKGVKIDGWQDIKGKRLGLPTGADTWVRFAAKIYEEKIPYSSLSVVNIQGSQQNSLHALRRGEVDAIVTWEPAESQANLDGIGYWDTGLDFSTARATGPEIGMIAASKTALRTKPEAVRIFAWAYLDTQNALVADREKLIAAMEAHTGVDARLARSMTDNLKLGGDALDAEQVRRHAKIMFDLGILQKDVSEAAAKQFDPSVFASAKAKP